MAKGYYVKETDSVFGPATGEQIRQMVAAGRITRNSLIATSAIGPWHPASSARGLEFDKVAPVGELSPPTPPPLPIVVQPVSDTTPSLNRWAKLIGKQWKVVIIGSVLLMCVIIVGIYSLVTNSDSTSSGNTGAVSGEPSLEACVTCGKSVSAIAKVCPHCGEPYPSPSARDAIATEQARKAKEKQRKQEAQTGLIYAQLLGADLLTQEGRDILLLGDEQSRLAAMRDLLDKGKDALTGEGRKLITEYESAVAEGKTQQASKILDKIQEELRRRAAAARQRQFAEERRRSEEESQRRTEQLRQQLDAAFQRLRQEIEQLAKQDGKLPDEDRIAVIAFTDAMRDPWNLALKYKIVDAQTGKYIISSAGSDQLYATADDPQREFQLGKP